ncbi:MAG: outer membrane protein assembly factor BamA [Pseudomonadota bacterium]
MMMLKRIFCLFAAGLACTGTAYAFDPFEVKTIQIEGAQRVTDATVLNYLPIKPGDKIDDTRIVDAIHVLFKTGFFADVRIKRLDIGILLVELVERPSISEVKIVGNKEITTEQLNTALKQTGLAEGRIFNRSILEKVEQELQRQYFNAAKYGVQINSVITPKDLNRVAINIDINEGEVARIKQIEVIGNNTFAKSSLLSQWELSENTAWASISGSSKYSKQKLQGDLESLRSHYMDRGYINFSIDSTQVSISPDKTEVFITVNVTEGTKYKVSKVAVTGDTKVPEEELRKLISLREGDTFSRKMITESSTRLSERLGVEGYAFANVNAAPDIDKDKETVALTFFVDPGKRVYVRRINFAGNTKTQDEVLRREMRQLEGGWISTTKLNRSRVRLQRTGFFDDINVETPPVAGTNDQVDVNFTVVERASGSVNAQIGYQQGQGLVTAASVHQNNFLGTGKQVSAEVNNTSVNRVYSFSTTDPYYTLDGVSRSFRTYYRKTTAGYGNVAPYTANVYGGSMSYGVPLSEYNTARMELTYDDTLLSLEANAPASYWDFVNKYSNHVNTLSASSSWVHDTRNRALFPESGHYVSMSGELSLPLAKLTFYKMTYREQHYWKLLFADWIFHLDGTIAYGGGYGGTTELPFYENYYAGGDQGVRGFAINSLGPKDSATGKPLGGRLKTIGTGEIFLPLPFSEASKQFRMSGFVDMGNVFGAGERLDVGAIRAAYGFGAVWITPIGALKFSWAWPLHVRPGDQEQIFQFSIGAPF